MKICKTTIVTVILVAAIAFAAGYGFTKIKKQDSQIAANGNPNDNPIGKYIQEHPQEIMDSLTKYQQEQIKKQDMQAEKVIASKWKEISQNPNDPVGGNPKGDVTIVEFFDYSCGYCKHVLPNVIKLLDSDKNLKVVFKEFPILSANSETAAKYALAANIIDPNKYINLHKEFFAGNVSSGNAAIKSLATKAGYDADKLEEKIKDPKITQILTENRNLAVDLGIRGTPAFIINGKLIPGAVDFDALQAMVKEARNNKK